MVTVFGELKYVWFANSLLFRWKYGLISNWLFSSEYQPGIHMVYVLGAILDVILFLQFYGLLTSRDQMKEQVMKNNNFVHKCL